MVRYKDHQEADVLPWLSDRLAWTQKLLEFRCDEGTRRFLAGRATAELRQLVLSPCLTVQVVTGTALPCAAEALHRAVQVAMEVLLRRGCIRLKLKDAGGVDDLRRAAAASTAGEDVDTGIGG